MSSNNAALAVNHAWFQDKWPESRVNLRGHCCYIEVRKIRFRNWNCKGPETRAFQPTKEGKAQAHMLLDLIARVEAGLLYLPNIVLLLHYCSRCKGVPWPTQAAAQQMHGLRPTEPPLLHQCLSRLAEWLEAQREDYKDPRPWLAYQRVSSLLDSERCCSHLTDAVKEWMDVCMLHGNAVESHCQPVRPMINNVRGPWAQPHLLQYLINPCPPLHGALTTHWSATSPWRPELLEDSGSNHPSRENSSLTNVAPSFQQAQAVTALPAPPSRAPAILLRYTSVALPGDTAEVQPGQQATDGPHQQQQHAADSHMQPAAVRHTPEIAGQPVFQHPWTDAQADLINAALQMAPSSHGAAQMLQEAMTLDNSATRQFWRPRAVGLSMFNEGDVALSQDGKLHNSCRCSSTSKCKGHFVVVCGEGAVPDHQGAGYHPASLESLQGNWCCSEGCTVAWVYGEVKSGALLTTSPNEAGCAQVLRPWHVSSLQSAVAVALESKGTPGKGRIKVFISAALRATDTTGHTASVAELCIKSPGYHQIIKDLNFQEDQLADSREKSRQQYNQQALRTQLHVAPLLTNLNGIYKEIWHSTMLQPAFLTGRPHVPRQHAALQAVAASGVQQDRVQAFLDKYDTVLSGVKQGLDKIASINESKEGMQLIKTASNVIGRQKGFDSDDIIYYNNDILARALMGAERHAEAAKLLAITVEICKSRYGISSLVTAQCQRNLAQAYLQQYYEPQKSRKQMQNTTDDQPASSADHAEWALHLSRQDTCLSLARDALQEAHAGLDFDKQLGHSLQVLAVRAALRFDLAQLHMSDRFVEARMELEQGMQLAKQYYSACVLSKSCPVDADLRDTMVHFARCAAKGDDLAVASMVLNALAPSSWPISSKRSWTFACMVALAAVVTAGCSGTLTHMTASLGNSQILIVCVLLVVVAMGVRG